MKCTLIFSMLLALLAVGCFAFRRADDENTELEDDLERAVQFPDERSASVAEDLQPNNVETSLRSDDEDETLNNEKRDFYSRFYRMNRDRIEWKKRLRQRRGWFFR